MLCLGAVEVFRHPGARAAAVVVAVGVVLGLYWALRVPLGGSPPPVSPPDGGPASFATYFVHFLPGRTHDGSRPTANKQLLRATKFIAGERVGLRVQTAPGVVAPFVVELRFLSPATREELPDLQDDRQRFRIRPGLRTYCCLKMPREVGHTLLSILVGDQFLADMPIEVKESPSAQRGGLFRVESE